MHTREEQMQAFGRLLDIMDELREKCPWDHVQTNESLRQNTIEEVFELGDALLKDNKSDICKELGDILLHIVFYAKIGSETGDFDIKDVCDKLCDKLIFRHPHVFGSANVDGQEQVLQNWEQLKLKEKGGNKRVLAGVPDALPSIIKAFRIQEKVAHVGFDWRDPQGALEKVLEEYDELIAEIKAGDKEKSEAELGDLLFSIINLARLYDIHPDNALDRTNRKFIDRFNYMEESAIRQGRQLKEMSLEELDSLWNEAKTKTAR
ncbi:MAG TPA: nucleoside triphosphate pyrophosphohydrolase [Bacteroidaceae bacterium]|jgi:XTP/dITP diphosphohydrolase|nr:nucleoside triphosphate pyrophosphohydrolase [Bacteroidaceae bacterium]MBP8602641.1 nucleoside triphosphate pyrophosphohydrolase [Bacteroidaceae bacterium]HOD68969.1 nucleoside triphosphate pyrophosphohydrolase [Bacteroidaceae bacterium]HPB03347.1 nucleoside triphosphate pyrophosphohydrolase [Bacteroidaceae bacterium]HPX98399.1 nucleoside triphosphate pyrophosphohydrolase [Bacteroidaceae bacterium]